MKNSIIQKQRVVSYNPSATFSFLLSIPAHHFAMVAALISSCTQKLFISLLGLLGRTISLTPKSMHVMASYIPVMLLFTYVYYYFDNTWWIMLFEGTMLIDIFPE